MAWEPVRVYPATMGSALTLSNEVDLKRYFRKISLVIPTHASASDWFIQGSDVAGGTYRRIASVVFNTASVQLNDFKILSAVSNRIVEIPGLNFRYVKIEASTAPANGIVFKLICGG